MMQDVNKENISEVVENVEVVQIESDMNSDDSANDNAKAKKSVRRATVKKSEEKTDETDYKSAYLRTLADFDNFRKRIAKERAQQKVSTVADVIAEILPIMDSINNAITVAENSDDAPFKEGMEAILRQADSSFTKLGIKPIDAVGKQFDPTFHNAIMHIDDESHGENEVIEEFSKGYIIDDYVIRHSIVKVAN
ncbi:MAG: nucleotide exchange factor GrpE [Clostridiales bacterium]|jgi:molecular chaperone GrpE|nr:nucleotide exchange factor GrpE [Clostridiales bacterium]